MKQIFLSLFEYFTFHYIHSKLKGMKTESLDNIEWNEFHHISLNSIEVLQIQTIEFKYFSLHSISRFTNDPNIA
jgi:hypothetical protein